MDLKDKITEVRKNLRKNLREERETIATVAAALTFASATIITPVVALNRAIEKKSFNPDKDFAAAVDGFVDNYAFYGEMAIPSNTLQLDSCNAVYQIERYMNTDRAFASLSHKAKEEIASTIYSSIKEIEEGNDSSDDPIKIETGSKYGKADVSVATPKGYRGLRGKKLNKFMKEIKKRDKYVKYGVVHRDGIPVR